MIINMATVVFLTLALSVIPNFGPRTGAGGSSVLAQAPASGRGAQYLEESRRRVKYNACIKSGRPDCYAKAQEAIEWCMKNWDQCFPLISGAGVHAGTYGDQIAEKCFRELDRKCREESGM